MQTNCYKQKYVVINVKHSASVMVWGCFSGVGGWGFLYFLPHKTTMNGERYIEMLKEKLLFWMNHQKASHFLQDGAPCHKSKKVMAFLQQQNFSVIDWPRNSRSESYQEPVVHHQGSDQVGKRHLAAPSDQGNQGDLGHPAQAPDGQAGALHADKNQYVPGKCWPDDQILVKT
jgi:hypothetical protein